MMSELTEQIEEVKKQAQRLILIDLQIDINKIHQEVIEDSVECSNKTYDFYVGVKGTYERLHRLIQDKINAI